MPVPQESLDPASARAISRVILFCAFLAAWCGLVHLATARPVAPAPMLLAASGAAAAFALLRRDRPWGPALTFWDEALAFLGLAALSRLLWGTP